MLFLCLSDGAASQCSVLNTFLVPGTVLGVLPALAHFILTEELGKLSSF